MNKAQKALAKEAQEILALHSLKERYWSDDEWYSWEPSKGVYHGRGLDASFFPRGHVTRRWNNTSYYDRIIAIGVIDNAR